MDARAQVLLHAWLAGIPNLGMLLHDWLQCLLKMILEPEPGQTYLVSQLVVYSPC